MAVARCFPLIGVVVLISIFAMSNAEPAAQESPPIDEPDMVTVEEEPTEKPAIDPAYAKNSMCGYCKYCKFCALCKTDCPCTDMSRVGCDMCQYCSYCKLCKVCDNFCQAGGFLDSLTSSLLSMVSDVDTKKVEEALAANPKIKEYL